jgi:hypothetical protein
MNLPGIAQGFGAALNTAPDHLIAGEFPRICRLVTITGGAVYAAGSVLGMVSASKHFRLSVAAANDGSEVPDVVLAHAVDATQGDVPAHVYFTGEFNSGALTLGAGHTPLSVSAAFRTRSIFLRHHVA